MRLFLLFLFLSFSGLIKAQLPLGNFEKDTISIGQSVKYKLMFSHNEAKDVLFPDSFYNYGSFIFLSKETFPTITSNGVSLDKAVYTLSTFELDSFQKLSLPVFLVNGNDSTPLYAKMDSVFLKQKISSSNLAQLKPKSESIYYKLKSNVNLYRWLIIIFSSLFILTVLGLIFRKALSKKTVQIKDELNHRSFLKKHRQYQKEVLTTEKANEGLINWKNYLEKIDKKPYSSLSSSEIYKELKDQRLLEALREIDAVIYGNKVSGSAQFAFIVLGEIANNQFKKIKNKSKDE